MYIRMLFVHPRPKMLVLRLDPAHTMPFACIIFADTCGELAVQSKKDQALEGLEDQVSRQKKQLDRLKIELEDEAAQNHKDLKQMLEVSLRSARCILVHFDVLLFLWLLISLLRHLIVWVIRCSRNCPVYALHIRKSTL